MAHVGERNGNLQILRFFAFLRGLLILPGIEQRQGLFGWATGPAPSGSPTGPRRRTQPQSFCLLQQFTDHNDRDCNDCQYDDHRFSLLQEFVPQSFFSSVLMISCLLPPIHAGFGKIEGPIALSRHHPALPPGSLHLQCSKRYETWSPSPVRTACWRS